MGCHCLGELKNIFLLAKYKFPKSEKNKQVENNGLHIKNLHKGMKGKSEIEVAQSCPTFSDPVDCSLPGSSIHGIFQARVLEWGAIAFSGAMHLLSHFSCVRLCATP